MHILVVEDEPVLAATLRRQLKDAYMVQLAGSGQEALARAENNDYQLIVLDLGLPDMNGLEVCRELRAGGTVSPILVLTANDRPEDKVTLLDAGADDYLTKPFQPAELKARLRALLRRNLDTLAPSVVAVADLELDSAGRTVRRRNQSIALRRKEFDLLEYLMRNSGKTLTRGMILDNVWEVDCDIWANSVDVHIKHLRDKIDRPFGSSLIKTVHGLGYKLEA